MKVLLIRLSAIGDVVHTMPTAVAIKRAHPDWQLDWIVQKELSGLLSEHPAVDRVLTISRRMGLAEARLLRTALRAEQYDVALDMQGLFKSGRIAGMSGAKMRLGYHRQREFSWLFSRAVDASDSAHVVEQYAAVAEALGCPGKPVDFGLRPTPGAIRWAEAALMDLNLEGRPLAVNFGSAKPEKRWPITRWAEFLSLARQDGWAPVAIGSVQDADSYEQLKKTGCVPPASLIGKTTLEQLVAVLSLCDAHVGGDTGSTHLAVALGKPIACMMGPTDPKRSGPYGRLESVAYRGRSGLAEITAEEVMERLIESDSLRHALPSV